MTDPDARLEQIRQREQDATKYNLRLIRYDHGGGRLAQFIPRLDRSFTDEERERALVADFYDAANREFYYHARADIPYLLAELTRLRAELAHLRALPITALLDHAARSHAEAAEAALTEAQHRALAAEQERDRLRAALLATRDYDYHNWKCRIPSCAECDRLHYLKVGLRVDVLPNDYLPASTPPAAQGEGLVG